jgi:hypothetical protein
MARPRKQASPSGGAGSSGGSSEISGGQASYILNRLLGERRITRADVVRYVTEMGHEISALERRLDELRAAHGGKIAAAAGVIAAGAAAVTIARRRGRPPGSGKKAAAAAADTGTGTTTGKRRGRPPGSGKRRGRPPGSGKKAAAAGAGATTTSTGTTGASAPSGGAKRRGRKPKTAITAGQLASRQLQGRYLALVRQFPENRRAQYARTAKDKGREAAIQEMQDALKK